MITFGEFLDTLPGRPTPEIARAQKSAERNVRRLTTLLVQHEHSPPGAVVRLDVEDWPQVAAALGNLPESRWAKIASLGAHAVPGLAEALAATITPAPVVDGAPDVTPPPKSPRKR